jgi:hypothetical protein
MQPPALPDLSGEWIGRYPGHFDEIVAIAQTGPLVEAVKVTGDEHVPAGEITWQADLRTLQGRGQVAEYEFHRARFVPGRLEFLGPERIVFHWENMGSVEYRRDE